MNPYSLIAPIAGVLAAIGVAMLIWWIRGLEPRKDRALNRRSRVLDSGVATMRRQRVIRIGISVAVGLGAWLLTGWPVGGVAGGCAEFFRPAFFTVGRQMEQRIERLEALEEWVRRLADSMAVGSAPIATIVRSAARAPEAIRPEVSELAQRLGTARWDRSVALRQFADRIDDSLGDVIGLALEIAVSARASERVPGVLRQMADAAAEEVKASGVHTGHAVGTTTFASAFGQSVGTFSEPLLEPFLALPLRPPLAPLMDPTSESPAEEFRPAGRPIRRRQVACLNAATIFRVRRSKPTNTRAISPTATAKTLLSHDRTGPFDGQLPVERLCPSRPIVSGLAWFVERMYDTGIIKSKGATSERQQ
jgi:hypothetical protein